MRRLFLTEEQYEFLKRIVWNHTGPEPNLANKIHKELEKCRYQDNPWVEPVPETKEKPNA